MTGDAPPLEHVEGDFDHSEKRVSWVELFFDLVLVFAITQVAALLHHEPTWGGAARALVVFIPIYWGWVGTSIHGNTNDVDTPLERLAIVAIGLAAFVMALAVPGAFGTRGALFAVAYLGLRIILVALLSRERRLIPGPYTLALFVTAPLLILGSAFSGHTRLTVWAIAGVLDLSSPRLFRHRLINLQIDPSHLPERYGLFVLIALGESIASVGLKAAAHPELSAAVLSATIAAFVLTCAMWWTYFAFGASAIHYAIEIADVRVDMIRQVLTYAHLVFVGAIVAVAVGLSDVVSEPSRPLASGSNALLFGGCATYLLTFGYTRYRMFRLHSVTRIPAGLACALLLPLGTHLDAGLAVTLLALVLVSLNVIEYVRVRRNGSL